jgi:hypothetical protein
MLTDFRWRIAMRAFDHAVHEQRIPSRRGEAH